MTDDNWLDDVDVSKDMPVPDEQVLTRLARCIKDLGLYEATVSDLEKRLALAKDNVRTVSERDIPNIFDEAGISSFTTIEGKKVSVKRFVAGKILRPEAFDWFEDRELEDIVKVNVSVSLRRSEGERIGQVLRSIEALGLTAETKESIHHSTLSAVLMELSTKAMELPPSNLVDIYFGRKTIVK